MKNIKLFLVVLLFHLLTISVIAQNIIVVPKGFVNNQLKTKILFHPDSAIVLEWAGNLNSGGFKIKLGSQTGTYDYESDYFPMTVNGVSVGNEIYHQSFTAEDVALPTGRYYGIITNSQYNTISEISGDANALYSNEFQIIVTSRTAPTATAPLGTINDPTPTFAWNAIPGVVSYWLLLSSNPFEITTDSLGNISIEGANLIWNYTTNQTSAHYGDVNPLNPYDMGTPPPLLPGQTYNYVILNLYEENNPIFGSPVTSGIFSFTYEAEEEQEPPTLLTPADSSYFDATPQITFSWEGVDWANIYTIYLFQRLYSFGGNDQTIDVPIWNSTTTNTQITYDAGSSLTKGTYVWYVVPSDDQGAGIASETFSFYYNKELGVFRLKAISTVDGSSLLNFQATAVAIEGGITPANPFLVIDATTYTDSLVLGTYQFTGSKVGFSDTTITVEITADNDLSNPRIITFPFTPLPGIINGTVLENGSGLPVSNATVTLTNTVTNTTTTTITNSSGNFSFSTRYGSYYITISKQGYVSSDQIFFNLNEPQHTLETVYLTKDVATVSGKILNDLGSPVQLANVTATDGSTTFQTNSSGDGDYSFTLTSGAWTISVSKTGFISPTPLSVTLATGDNLQNQNLTLIPRAAQISGTIYKSANGTSVPLAGVEITAEPLSGQPVTVTSANDGTYSFSLRYGTYTFSASKTSYSSSEPVQLTLGLGQTITGVNFTLTPNPSSVSGRVLLADGSAITNATITADNSITAISDVNGNYQLFLNEGTHELAVSKEGYIPPSPVTLSLQPGENFTGIDFTLTPNAGIISGHVTNNGTAIYNALVTASDGATNVTANADANGEYSISVQPGSWDLTASKSGFICDDTISVNIAPGQTSANNNFNLIQNIATISGVTKSNGVPLGNVSVAIVNSITGAQAVSTTSNSNGVFSAVVEASYAYDITATMTGYSNGTYSTNVLQPESSLSVELNLTPNPSSVSGIIYSSSSETLSGATITIKRTDGTIINTLTSEDDGTYYSGVQAGDYIIVASKAGYSEAQTNVSVSVGQNLTNVNLTLDENFASISGSVLDSQGGGIPGAMINAISDNGGRTVFSLSDGSFLINRLVGGEYEISFTKAGYSDTTIYNYSINDGENKTVNVSLILLTGVANGHVTTTGGTPIEGATVKLLPNGKTYIYATTNEDGYFQFNSLAAGDYVVSAEKSGYRSSLEIPFTISAQDSVVTVNINDFELNVAQISGKVTDASNGAALQGAVVSITGTNGSASATTNATGDYVLANIPPGDYQLSASLQNYSAETISITVTDTTSSLIQNIAMNKTTGAIAGSVTDDNGSPLGFAVNVIASSSSNSYSTQTQSDGTFLFTDVAADSGYSVRTEILREGYQNVTVSGVVVSQNQTTNVGELHPVISLSKIYGNAGIDNAYITLVNSNDGTTDVQTSNALGDYSFNFLQAGDYVLSVQKEGYVFTPSSANVTLSVYEEKEVNFTAVANIGTINARVSDESGSGISGAIVSVISSDTSVVRTLETNTQGGALFEELPAGEYIITPSLEGYSANPQNATKQINAGDSVYVEFTMVANSAAVSGKIKKYLSDGSTQPLSGATIEAKRISTGQTYRATSDENGNYSIENLARENYSITATKTGFTSQSQNVDLAGGSAENINFTLNPEIVILKGSVVSRNAEDIDSLTIKAVSPLGEFSVLTNASGEFTFDELPIYVGENDTTVYNVGIQNAQFSSVSRQIRIPSSQINSQVTLEPFLLPSGEITITTKECDEPLSNVSVTIVKPDGNVIRKLTDNSGVVSTGTNLFAGDYSIGVTINGYLLPTNYSVTLSSDTANASVEIQLPYKFREIDEMLSNEATNVQIDYPKNCPLAPDATAKAFYKLQSAALYEEVQLTPGDSAFTGEIPALFTAEKIDYYVSVNNNGVKYKSDIFEITPKAAGILTQVIFNPAIDNILIRKDDSYKISLILRDGVNNSLADKFTGANHPGKIVWSVPEGFSFAFPNDNDSTVIILNADGNIEENATLGVTATLNGVSVSRSAVLNVNDLQITSLSISKPQNRISNRSAGIQFSLTGKDSTGRTITLGSGIEWSISPITAIAEEDYQYFTETGFYKPIDSTFVGIVTVKAEDALSGLSDETQISVYAEIYPSTASTITNGSGFSVRIPANAVTVPIELEVSSKVNKSVKKYVTPLNSSKKFMAANNSYAVYYNSSTALPGDSLQRYGSLELPVSNEFKFTEGDKIISFYDAVRKRWILLGSGKSSVSGNVTEYNRFTRFGEYSILAQSEPLSIKYASVLPNPFSPQIAPVKIGYYLTSDAPPVSVTIKIYNINGELVRTLFENDLQFPGRYGSSSSLKEITWDGKTDGGFTARNGRYIVRISAKDGNNETTKLLQVILIK